MNLQQLEYFKIVSETLNYTKASKILSVTQPTLSKSISKLEEELEVKLFQKKGRNIILTPFGEIFLKHANLALIEIETGISKINCRLKCENKSLLISSTPSVSKYFMPFVITEFLDYNSNLKINFNYQKRDEILYDLKNGKIDLGFYYGFKNEIYDKEITSIPIKREDYVIIVPKGHKLSNKEEVYLEELKDEKFIAFCEERSSDAVSYLDVLGYIPKISVEPSNSSMLESLVSTGAGISIIPNTPLINKNTISTIKIKDKVNSKYIYMAFLKDHPLSEQAKLFKDFILKKYEFNNK